MGMVLAGRMSVDSVNARDLYPPYPRVMRAFERGDKEPESLMERFGIQPIRAAIDAAQHTNGLPVSWPVLLEKTAARSEMADRLISLGDALKSGKNVDFENVVSLYERLQEDPRRLVPLSEVRPEKSAFQRSGFAPLDKYIGGVPKANLTVVGGPTGVGKTTLIVKVLSEFVKKYKTKRAAFFSLEMTMQQIAQRSFQVQNLTKEQKSRLYLCDEILNVADVGSILSRSEGMDLVAVDFAEMLLDTETSESAMAMVYLSLTRTAKRLKVPIILISQLSRAYTSTGGIPRINHLRYTGMAEQLSALVLLIYNPFRIFADYDEDNAYLPAECDKGYLIVAKSRYGTKSGDLGAIQLPWDGVGGWGTSPSAWMEHY